MAQQILDYVWVNEEYEICSNRVVSALFYNNVRDIPQYTYEDICIKPHQLFKNPFLSSSDILVFCDMYRVNLYIYPNEKILSEQNQRNDFKEYMEKYTEPIFKITETYYGDQQAFRQHKQLCRYVGIDVFCKPCEYSIYSEKKNIYNYIWISRYILNQLSGGSVKWLDMTLVPNVEEDVTRQVKQLDVVCMDELFDDFHL